MEYADLIIVLAIYKEGSFTAAARRLYTTQPAVSQRISRLEQELNLCLFVRSKGAAVPTSACETLVKYAGKISSQWSQMEDELKSVSKQDALHIGTTSFFFRFLAPLPDLTLAKKSFDFQYTITEDSALNVERLTSEGKLDFCFTRAPLQQADLLFEQMFTEEIFFAVPEKHPYCKGLPKAKDKEFPTVDLADFCQSDFVLVNNPRITPLCLSMCRHKGYQPKVTMQPVTWEHVIMGIRSGYGVGFISNLHISENDVSELRFFRIKTDAAKLVHGVAYRPAYKLGPQAKYFIREVRKFTTKYLDSI